MAYPDYTTLRSIAGACPPTYLTASLSGGYTTGQTFTVASTSGWYEVSSSGTATTNPLGTSGIFTLVLDAGNSFEEKVLCSGAVTIGTNQTITVWTDGTRNGRGYDGTSIQTHPGYVSPPSTYNVYPVPTATDSTQVFNAINTFLPISGGTISGNLTVASGFTVSGTSTHLGSSSFSGQTNVAFTSNSGSSLIVKQATITATVTAASGSGTTVTYTANNSFATGNLVTISGLGIASGASLNLGNVNIASASPTQFTVTNTTVGVSTGTGTATASPNAAGLAVQNAGGTTVFTVGNASAGATISEAFTSSSYIIAANAPLGGSISSQTYSSINYPSFLSTLRLNGVYQGDLYQGSLTNGSSVFPYKTFRVSSFGQLATVSDSKPISAIPISPANITAISAAGSTVTVTATHNFSTGQYVTITGLTGAISGFQGTFPIAVSNGTSFTYTATTSGTPTISSASNTITAVATSNPLSQYATYTTASAHGFWVGSTVTITGFNPTGYNVTNYIVYSVPTPTTFVIYNPTTSAITTYGAVTSSQAIATPTSSGGYSGTQGDTFQVQDIYQNPRFGISNTGTFASPAWAVNAYSGKIVNVASGSNPSDAVNFGQLSTVSGVAYAALPASGGTLSGSLNITGQIGNVQPAFHNYKAWAADIAILSANAVVPASGTVYFTPVFLNTTSTISGVSVYIAAGGTGLTSSYLGLYNSTTLLGQTAAITTDWQTSGAKTYTITGSLTNLSPGVYWVGLLVGSGTTTDPSFLKLSNSTTTTQYNIGITPVVGSLNGRSQSYGTNLTALPSSLSGLTIANSNYPFWCAIY